MSGDALYPWRVMAPRVGGALDEGGWLKPPSIRYAVHGRPSVLEELGRLGDADDRCARLTVDLRGRSPGTLKIFPEGFFSPIAKLFGAQDLRIGDPRFDSLYVVKATPPSLAAAVFGTGRREALIEALRALGKFRGSRVDLCRDQLRVDLREPATQASLQRMVDAAFELVGSILEGGTGQVPLWDVLVTQAGGRCPVCGVPIAELRVRCSRCRTPHHRECWDYVGTCSTYACGEKAWS